MEIHFKLLSFSESYKFIRMADDLHDVARYLNDMRICFIALTVMGYIILILYGIIFCVRRNRRQRGANANSRTRGRWDFQVKVTFLLSFLFQLLNIFNLKSTILIVYHRRLSYSDHKFYKIKVDKFAKRIEMCFL